MRVRGQEMRIASRSFMVVVLLCVSTFSACLKNPAKITQATFEPVYRSSKAIQGAIGPGVTYVKFGELLQTFSTEIAIARDHQLSGPDKKLLALYEDALSAYKFSAALWKLKLDSHDEVWKGEIPVGFESKEVSPEIARGLIKYGLVPENRMIESTGAKYQALPAESVQFVWLKADDILKQATEMYYGRPQPPPATSAPSSAPTSPNPPSTAPAMPKANWEVKDETFQVGSSDSTAKWISYKFSISNSSGSPVRIDATVQLLDRDGNVVTYMNRVGLEVSALSTQIVTGTTYVAEDSAQRIVDMKVIGKPSVTK